MADGGYILDEEAWRIVQEMIRHYRRFGGWNPTTGGDVMNTLRPREPAYFHNDSGEEIPAYACCQVTGTLELSGQNYLLVDKPADTTGDAGWYVFNGPTPVADNEEGRYQTGPIVRGYKNSGTITAGDKWGPTSGQWYVSTAADGPFIAAGADDIQADVLKLFTGSGSSGEVKFFSTGVGGIAARSGSTLGSATCTMLTVAGGTRATTSTTATVYNDFLTSIGASVDIAAAKVDGIWLVIAEDCT